MTRYENGSNNHYPSKGKYFQTVCRRTTCLPLDIDKEVSVHCTNSFKERPHRSFVRDVVDAAWVEVENVDDVDVLGWIVISSWHGNISPSSIQLLKVSVSLSAEKTCDEHWWVAALREAAAMGHQQRLTKFPVNGCPNCPRNILTIASAVLWSCQCLGLGSKLVGFSRSSVDIVKSSCQWASDFRWAVKFRGIVLQA